MAAAFSISFASSSIGAQFHRPKFIKPKTFVRTIRCAVGPRLEWDPDGILGPPQTGHIARVEFQKRLENDAAAREEFERKVREEKERRRVLRESRVIPDTVEGLVEFFLDTEAQEIEFEVARLRPRLNKEFFDHLQIELGKLRFSVNKTQNVEDRLVELETLQKALQEATEAYDKMQADLVAAKKNLTEILTSKDVKATVLDLVERNELNRPLLTLLDENIATAHSVNQVLVCVENWLGRNGEAAAIKCSLYHLVASELPLSSYCILSILTAFELEFLASQSINLRSITRI